MEKFTLVIRIFTNLHTLISSFHSLCWRRTHELHRQPGQDLNLRALSLIERETTTIKGICNTDKNSP
jgi:hypothetical protein